MISNGMADDSSHDLTSKPDSGTNCTGQILKMAKTTMAEWRNDLVKMRADIYKSRPLRKSSRASSTMLLFYLTMLETACVSFPDRNANRRVRCAVLHCGFVSTC